MDASRTPHAKIVETDGEIPQQLFDPSIKGMEDLDLPLTPPQEAADEGRPQGTPVRHDAANEVHPQGVPGTLPESRYSLRSQGQVQVSLTPPDIPLEYQR